MFNVLEFTFQKKERVKLSNSYIAFEVETKVSYVQLSLDGAMIWQDEYDFRIIDNFVYLIKISLKTSIEFKNNKHIRFAYFHLCLQ